MKSFRTSLNSKGGNPCQNFEFEKVKNFGKQQQKWEDSSKEEVLEEVEVRGTPLTGSTKVDKIVTATLQEKG